MKISSILNMSIKNILRNKRYIFYTLLNIICLSIFIITFKISLTYENKINKNIDNNPLLKLISINFDYEEIVNNKKYTEEEKQEIIENILKIDHVNDAIYAGNTNGGGNLKEENEDPNNIKIVILQPLAKNMTLPNQSYTKPLKLNEIIIPEKISFEYYDELNEEGEQDKFIDGKTLIGKTIPIYYDIYDCKNDKYVDRKYLDLKVVGTYDSTATGYPRYYSFSNVKTIEQEVNVINITDQCKLSDIYYFQIDEAKNINYVEKKIKKLGYSVSKDFGPAFVVPELYNKYVNQMRTISMLALLFLLVFRFAFCKKILNDNTQNIFILKILGYNHKEIIKQETIKCALIDIFSMTCIAIISYLAIVYYKTNYSNLVLIGFMVNYPYLILIILLLLLIVLDYLFHRIILKNKVFKND